MAGLVAAVLRCTDTDRQHRASMKDRAHNPKFAAALRSALTALCVYVGLADPAWAQLRALENPSFEANDPQGPGAANFQIFPISSVPGWDASTGEIELWDTNFLGVPAYDGNVLAEMNANTNGTLFQSICLINGEPLGWTFAHRARSGGPATQTARFEVANSSGTVLQTVATQASLTSNRVWNVNTGSTTYTGPSGLQRVQFTTTNPGSYGNFLDAIQLTLRPFVQLSAANTSAPESEQSASLATLRVTGTLPAAITVNVAITGGTAQRGTDYTTPGGGAAFTVNIPAGTYFNTAIPLGITIIDDDAVESSETITFAISAGTGYTLGHTTSCGSPVQTTGTYTILNNDARVTLSKQWADAIVGDEATLSLLRGASVLGVLASDAGSPDERDTAVSAIAVVTGETLTLSETLAGTNGALYDVALACTGTTDPDATDGLTIGASDSAIVCTYTNTRIPPPLDVTKTFTVVSDGVSPTDPKAIPGAILRYCLRIANVGTVSVTDLSLADTLPPELIFLPGTGRSGTDCSLAIKNEDDDALGPDETDPIGMSFDGTTVLGKATGLNPDGSFALVFDTQLK